MTVTLAVHEQFGGWFYRGPRYPSKPPWEDEKQRETTPGSCESNRRLGWLRT